MTAEWKARISDNWERAGLDIVLVRDLNGGGREITNGSTGWVVYPDGATTGDRIEPLRLNDEQGRALLAELLRHFNGADDARMLRKDYDSERQRVDLLIGKLGMPIVIAGGEVIGR